MTQRDDPAPTQGFITATEVRRLKDLGEPFRVRYETLPWTDRPTFLAVYTLADGAERAFVTTRVSHRGIKPKVLALWPGVWSHHREYGDGEPLVLRVTDPVGTEAEHEEDDEN